MNTQGNSYGLLGTPCYGALGYIWLHGVSIPVISLNYKKGSSRNHSSTIFMVQTIMKAALNWLCLIMNYLKMHV